MQLRKKQLKQFLFVVVCYLLAIVSVIWDQNYRFLDSYYLLKSIISIGWLISSIACFYSFEKNKRSLILIIPSGIVCHWWLVKITTVLLIWSISGFAP